MEMVSNDEVKVCPRFKKERFEKIEECPHVTELTHPDSNHAPIPSDSELYQMILACVSKTAFMNDLDKMKFGNMTSYVENFHSVCIKYRPKRKFFPKRGFNCRTMLAAMSYNENRKAEMRGDRRVSVMYQCFSKAKGEKVVKAKKSPPSEEWKKDIVQNAIVWKQEHGPGNPQETDNEEEELDFIIDKFEELLNFSDDDDFEE